MQSQQVLKLPVLLYLLQNKKFQQIIKGMLNEKVSKNMLEQYGAKTEPMSKFQQFKINQSVARFSVVQLIDIKGSSKDKVRECENQNLKESVRRKMLVEDPQKETRKILWVQFTEVYSKPHLYANLKKLELATEFQTSIQKDINRTFKSLEVKNQTQQVLGVFAQYNPYIGYCQGMNSIIAFLIDDGFTCEEAFFIFKKITETLLPCDYYNSMDSIMVYMRIFYEMLHFTHPKCYARLKHISKQLENSYIAMVSFVLQWFVCLFCNDNVNVEVTRVIWDMFLLEGISVLFKAGLAFFTFLENSIEKCDSFEQYNEMQKNCIKEIKDWKKIKKLISETYISSQILFLLKEKLSQQDEQSRNSQHPNKPPKTIIKKCNRKWNACFQTIENNLQNHHVYDFFVFKPAGDLNINHDYMTKLNQQYFHKEKLRGTTNEMIIGRIPHDCLIEQDLITEDSISEKNTDLSSQNRKRYLKSITDPRSPLKVEVENIRRKATQKIEQVMKAKKGMERSDSLVFMSNMVQNGSISNLLSLYDIDEMFEN